MEGCESSIWKGTWQQTCSERHRWSRTHVEEEVHILGATPLTSPRGPQRDRRDAPDEESLCEPARLHGCVWKPKDTFEARQDLRCLRERDNLHPEKTDDGCHYLHPASYTLSKEEKEIMFA